jgi:hypothetical protein
MVGPTPQMVEVGAATIGAGTRWRLPPPPPRPAAFLRFRPFEHQQTLGHLHRSAAVYSSTM